MGYTPAKYRLNGSFGCLRVGGTDIGEVSSVKIRVDVEYADVRMGMDLDKKMVGRFGSGSFTVTRAFTRSEEFLKKIQKGEMPSVSLEAWVADPDAAGGKEERVVIREIKLTGIDILSFAHGDIMRSEYPFTFAPSDLSYVGRIEPQ